MSAGNGAAPAGPRTSRRGFLKGVGLAAGAAATAGTFLPPELRAGQQEEEENATPGLRELGRGRREITLRINGREQAVTVEPRTTLLDVLRDQLGLTGSKEICDRGACGGCTVLVDGRGVTSCLYLAIDAVGHDVMTVEGIAADPRYANLVDAFCETDAAQCGYCIPGFLVRSAELLHDIPNPGEAQIREALSGNLCRCGAYTMIVKAVGDAAARGGVS